MNDNRKNGEAGDKPVSLFDFKGHKVRVVELEGEPWFVAGDVCGVLGLDNTSYVAQRLNIEEKHSFKLSNQRGRPAIIVSESGLYKLVMRSDKPEARGFQDWVTKTVLPAIRKDGGYIAGEEFVATGEMDEDRYLKHSNVAQNYVSLPKRGAYCISESHWTVKKNTVLNYLFSEVTLRNIEKD
ncbi:Bro-N domain-containing protein [Nitratireductor aquimarinus]|uniref:BRO-N domain-containing protein n=1 Tax=Nitratireductor aquimarinus TaxID=889300 RepID=UPI0029357F87|nr:Bro-N domain-containing protein [Nitratireductor aquimarinus]MDV2968846.1 Bro-N domain-containing protein [Nitratireductor aquimarinus]